MKYFVWIQKQLKCKYFFKVFQLVKLVEI